MGEEYTRRVTVVGSTPQAGDLIYTDDFESTFRWSSSADGNGTSVKSTVRSFSLANSVAMTSDTGAPAAGQFTLALRRLSLPPSRKIRASIYFFSGDLLTLREMVLELFWWDTITLSTARIIYKPQDFKTYLAQPLGDIAIPNSARKLNQTTWHRMQFDIDFLTGKYISAIMDTQNFDVSDTNFLTAPSTSNSMLQAQLRMVIDDAASKVAHFDDLLIITTL